MARVNIYERCVDAVFTDVELGDKSNLLEYGILLKQEPPDPDEYVPDDCPLFNINTRDQNETTVSEDRPTGLAQESTSNNSKFVFVSGQCETLSPKNGKSKRSLQTKANGTVTRTKLNVFCDICLLPFVSTYEMRYHQKLCTIKKFECRRCCVWFSTYFALLCHTSKRNCKQKRYIPLKYACDFCDVLLCSKNIVQSHLFHTHRDLILGGKNETGEREGTESKGCTNDFPKSAASVTSKNSNEHIDTSMGMLKNSNDTPVSSLDGSNIIAPQNSNSLTSTPNTFSKTSKTLTSSCGSSLGTSTPVKKMRQTSITKFVTRDKKVVKSEIISPEKANDTERVMVSLDTPRSLRDRKMSTSVRYTNSDTSSRETPFVRIHVDHRFMMKLLKTEINSKADSPGNRNDISYNLRSARKTLPPDRFKCETSFFNRKACLAFTPRRLKKPWVRLRTLKEKFNCKECTVLLERCDESIIRANCKSSVVNKEVDSEKGGGSSASAAEVGSQADRKKIHQCRVCSKRFFLKRNMRKHIELSHAVYVSSICNARYTTMDKLVNHYMHQHLVLKRKECCVCFEKLKTAALARQHMVSHCEKTIRSKKDTTPVNVEINCNAIKKRNRCRGCHKRFWLRLCLVEHEKVCRYANAQKDTQQLTPNIEGSSSLLSEEQDIPKANELPVTEIEISNNSVSSTSITVDALCSSTVADNSNERLNDGVGYARSYQVNISDRVKFPCTICGKNFQTFQNLCLHERTFCKPANNLCNICSTGFPTKRLLQLHMLATHTPSCMENYRFFCKYCKQGFLKKISLKTHERHFHLSQASQLVNVDCPWNVSPSCSICNLTFESYERFIEHNMYYYKGYVFVCLICDVPFQGLYLLHNHSKLMHYPEDMQHSYVYKCDICGIGFNSESHFQAHRQHVHAADLPSIMNSLNTFQEHNYALTTNDLLVREEPLKMPAKKYTCGVCTLSFTTQGDLSAHELEYSSDGDILCNKCNRRCFTSSILARHQSLNHTGSDVNTSYKCRFCGEVSTTSTSMLCHEKHFHTNCPTQLEDSIQEGLNGAADKLVVEDGKVTCFTCELECANRISLKHHLLEYSNIGEYSCTICQRKFTELYLLALHKVKHSRAYNTSLEHRCPICDEGFNDASNIRIHVLHLHRYESFEHNASDESETAQVADSVRNDGNPSTLEVTEVSKRSITASNNSLEPECLVQCPECDITFKSVKSLKKHRTRFVNFGNYNCTICGRRFPWQAMLKHHLWKHSNSTHRLLKHQCSHCEEKFRSSVSVYCHVIHIHGRDKLVHPDRMTRQTDSDSVDVGPSTFTEDRPQPVLELPSNVDSQGSERLNENLIQSPSKRPDVLAGDDSPSSFACDQVVPGWLVVVRTTMRNNDPNSAERTFYYSCAECSSRHSTLREFQAHFKAMHEKDKLAEYLTIEVDPITNEGDLAICDSNSVDRQRVSDQMPSPCKAANPSPANETESKERLPATNNEEQDSDVIEVIWEKKSNTPEVIIIDDSDVQIIDDNCQPSVSKQMEKDLLPDVIPVDKPVSTIKVKSFAQIISSSIF